MKQNDGTFLEIDAINDYKSSDRGPDNYYYYVIEIGIADRLLTLYTRSEEDRTKFLDTLSNSESHIFWEFLLIFK